MEDWRKERCKEYGQENKKLFSIEKDPSLKERCGSLYMKIYEGGIRLSELASTYETTMIGMNESLKTERDNFVKLKKNKKKTKYSVPKEAEDERESNQSMVDS